MSMREWCEANGITLVARDESSPGYDASEVEVEDSQENCLLLAKIVVGKMSDQEVREFLIEYFADEAYEIEEVFDKLLRDAGAPTEGVDHEAV